MVFKTLNLENDISSQGFEEHSYDLVIASLVLHATGDLNCTLSNVRRLLKPGGYLIMTEVSNNDVSRIGFMMCAMPGWWLGQNDDRKLSPCVPPSQWHDLLLRNGFNGVDSATPDLPGMPFPLAVMVSQAVDAPMEVLLKSTSQQSLQAVVDGRCEIVVVGGWTPMTASLVRELIQILEHAGISHSVFKSLADIDHLKTTEKSIALVLEELDQSVSNRSSAQSVHGFEELCSTQETVLLVGPARMYKGRPMSATLDVFPGLTVSEEKGCTIHTLKVDPDEWSTAQQFLQSLLTLHHGNELEKVNSHSNMLWANEPELAFLDSQTLVPRIYYNSGMNERFNASRRPMHRLVNCQDTSVEVVLRPMSTNSLAMNYVIVASDTSAEALAAPNDVRINVSHSILNFACGTTPTSHLIIGTDETTKVTTVAISSSNGSRVVACNDKTAIVSELPEHDRPQFLAQLHHRMQVDRVMAMFTEGSVLLLHEPGRELATSIVEGTAHRDITVFFTTCSTIPQQDGTWIKVATYPSQRQVLSSLPSNITVFVDCSTSALGKRTACLIASCFPDTCIKTSMREICATENVLLGSTIPFSEACEKTLRQMAHSSKISLTITDVDGVIGKSEIDYVNPTIMDWRTCSTASVPVSSIEGEIHFRADRTYVLFHFPSPLIQSLCDWMLKHGARNIAVTSRDHIDERWLYYVRSFGLRIEIFEDVVFDKHALESLVKDIQKEWPPVAGIGYGGLFMQQGVTVSGIPVTAVPQDLREVNQGAQNLDEISHYFATELEFFVLFSPLLAITDAPGRSIWSASGLFMAALARQRREKALAASLLYLGDVVGLSNGTRYYSAQNIQVENTTAQTLSERVFHLCVAEAMVSSHPTCCRNHEIIAGLSVGLQKDDNTPWSNDPRFQHILLTESNKRSHIEARPTVISTKMKLLDAQTLDDVSDIVTEAFSSKLKSCLQLPPSHANSRILSSGTDELGIDSLVAVEIRSWFLREIGADIPVFKILAGDKMAKLVGDAVLDIPLHLIPGACGKQPESGVKIREGNVAEGRSYSFMGERSITSSVSSSTNPSNQGNEQGEATDTSVSEYSTEKL